MTYSNEKTNKKVEELCQSYGTDKVFEAGIDVMLSNIKTMIMKKDWKEATKTLRKVADILEATMKVK